MSAAKIIFKLCLEINFSCLSTVSLDMPIMVILFLFPKVPHVLRKFPGIHCENYKINKCIKVTKLQSAKHFLSNHL